MATVTTAHAAQVEERLQTALAAWAALSVAGGTGLWWTGWRSERPALAAFGRQNVMWGIVDGVIAAVGFARRSHAADPKRARDLRRLLLGNAALDVGYIAAGAAAIASRDRLAEWPRYSEAAALGDGTAIIVQGTFLFALDSVTAFRLGLQTGDPVGDEVSADHGEDH